MYVKYYFNVCTNDCNVVAALNMPYLRRNVSQWYKAGRYSKNHHQPMGHSWNSCHKCPLYYKLARSCYWTVPKILKEIFAGRIPGLDILCYANAVDAFSDVSFDKWHFTEIRGLTAIPVQKLRWQFQCRNCDEIAYSNFSTKLFRQTNKLWSAKQRIPHTSWGKSLNASKLRGFQRYKVLRIGKPPEWKICVEVQTILWTLAPNKKMVLYQTYRKWVYPAYAYREVQTK